MTSRKATAVLLALLVTVTSFTALPKDAKAAASTKFEALDFSYDRDDVYTNYIKKYENAAHPEVEIAVPAASFASGGKSGDCDRICRARRDGECARIRRGRSVRYI